jgi:hypothetical protein
MPYLGNEPGAITDAFTDTFTGDGSETAFTLTQASTTNSVFVRIHGVMQRNGTDFTVDGTTLTFTTAPPNASNNVVVQFFTIGSVQAVADNGITLAKLAHGTDGNLITYDTAGAPAAVATGNDGQVLTSAGAGAAPAFETLSGLGKVVQVVNVTTGAVATGTAVMPMDDTIPQNNEGNEVMTLAITPTSSSNYLLIESTILGACSSDKRMVMALFQDSTAGALSGSHVMNRTSNYGNQLQLSHYMAAGTTSETTFKIRAGANATTATFTFNGAFGARIHGGVSNSAITITEISA